MVTKVGVLGATGRLGKIALAAFEQTPDLVPVVVDPRGDLKGLADVDVVFESTVYAASEQLVRAAVATGVPIVVATSGWSGDAIAKLEAEGGTRVRIVPNFSLGSVLSTYIATVVAAHMPTVEIVETHHDRKVDAPSGTAIRTAEALGAIRDFNPATPNEPGRGHVVAGVPVHALRLPGVAARQDVVFGGTGETLTIRHDTLDGSSYSAGIVLAVQAAPRDGVTLGLNDLLGL